jgi:hypothetical protein
MIHAVLSKPKLEDLCLLYVRQYPRCAFVQSIKLKRPEQPTGLNWVVAEIMPRPSLIAEHCVRLAIKELQKTVRMVS